MFDTNCTLFCIFVRLNGGSNDTFAYPTCPSSSVAVVQKLLSVVQVTKDLEQLRVSPLKFGPEILKFLL
jgi:hypothetical protein